MVLSKAKLICKNCQKDYVYTRSYDKHVSTCIKSKSNICKSRQVLKSLGKNKLDLITGISNKYGTWLDIFGFSDDYWVDNLNIHVTNAIINNDVHTYHNYLNDFSSNHLKELKILHLNINSIFSKVDFFHEILDSGQYDILFINESKLNVDIPDSHISHSKYKCYRRDRDYLIHTNTDKRGGGIVIYIRKEYVHSVQKADSFEVMHLNLILKDTSFNFVACYKSPSTHNQAFIDYLDNVLLGINLSDPLFIIGDLIMDLLSPNSNPLKEFIELNKFKNFINEPTRVK